MGTFRDRGEVFHPLQGHETKQQFESAWGHLLITLEISVPIVRKKRAWRTSPDTPFNEPVPRHTYAYMLRQAGVSKKIRAEMSGRFIETAMKHGHPKAREKGRAVEALDEMATTRQVLIYGIV